MKYLIRKPDTFMSNLNDEINSLLKRNFDTVFPEYVFEREIKGLSLPVDIQEFDNEYKVKVEIPGIKKEDVNIELNKNYLTISAEKNEKTEEKDEKNKKYHKTEFRYGSYSRTVYFPHEVNVNDANASVDNGVLTIEIPKLKREEEDTKKIEVK